MNDDDSTRSTGNGDASPQGSIGGTVRTWLRAVSRMRNGENSVRAALEELIEEGDDQELPFDGDERQLLFNILGLRDRTVHDVMVPRVDIEAVEASSNLAETLEIMTGGGHSRLPIFRGALDDVIGMVHIKDVVAWRGSDEDFSLARVLRKLLFVSPSMRVLELLLEMRITRSHMALVVDEFGGIDGLVTIEDLVEEIVGEIEDEHDRSEGPLLVRRTDGGLDADARATIEELEAIAGPVVSEEEREDIDTLGGLLFSITGRVPVRGELVRHSSGLEFEVIDADPRRVKRLRVRNLPAAAPEVS